ncbi:cytochrome c oxidase subunit 5B, mitochondrial-like [Centruroides sculpturatus]|uniref:cytochrome c oxidase subunit 5B, mitochondrial-like n=1 Tax=Centruroides sculpturatus TaxID=218467 RepID=UPI000C6E46A3|nr:cytochrome c oxidase subunit 5B, mitochondrial-like [Centruroides sculpturatus]
MSYIIGRGLLSAVKRSPCIFSSCRTKIMFNDPIEHATGLEKKELLAIQSGNEDPFNMRVYKRGPGTKDKPTEIPSMLDKRLIGCICHEDSTHINYMWLHMGDPKRCECGYWFKLVPGKFL